MTRGPIGVFDSGFGGLTILKSLRKKLPQYDFLYLGDNARSPYGRRSFENVYQLSQQGVRYLLDHGCPLVIVACNTASAKALRSIQQMILPVHYPDRRVLGIIRPTIEAVLETSKHVGILATPGTVTSHSYIMELQKVREGLSIIQEACPMWAPLVEAGEWESEGTEYFVKKHLRNLFAADAKIDTLILACTHYPMLLPVIKKYLPQDMNIIDQGVVVADKLEDYLTRHPEIEMKCKKGSEVKFLTTETPDFFDNGSHLIFGEHILSTQIEL